jgi:hypothetical protein
LLRRKTFEKHFFLFEGIKLLHLKWVLILITSFFISEAGNYMQATASSKLKQGDTLERKKPNFLQVSTLSYYFLLMIFAPTPTSLFCIVADRGCLSRIQIFVHPGPRIPYRK